MSASVVINAADQGLAVSLKRSEHWNRMKAFGLVIPLLLFILITFMVPIVELLFNSVDNSIVPASLPKTTSMLTQWEPKNFGVARRGRVQGAERRAPSQQQPGSQQTRFPFQLRAVRHPWPVYQKPRANSAARAAGRPAPRKIA
ncbi:hypothetical protein ACFS07_19575 [Undibacterium arcticum]